MPYGEESVGSEVLGISRVANASEEICFHDAIVLVVHLLEVFSWIVTAAPADRAESLWACAVRTFAFSRWLLVPRLTCTVTREGTVFARLLSLQFAWVGRVSAY